MSRPAALALAGVLGLLALVLLLVFVVRLASQSGGGTLGDDTFDVNASTLARQIARDGPILVPDLLGQGRDIYIQHLSDDRKLGWLAFRATAPGGDRSCTLSWDRAERLFRDPCPAGGTYPADGAGLEQYPASVQGSNRLVVDLRRTVP
ncbi:MAG: hypothetical protein ABIS47_06270 [Acidimicrobiales bacterium]